MQEHNERPCCDKFLALEEDKRERIISAAMKELAAGYKKASTDNIVREAGISKGMLFHYFGTKENLYRYLVEYAADILRDEFLSIWNVRQPDILDSLWQASMLKHDLSLRYPAIFDFMANTYSEAKTMDIPEKEAISNFFAMRKKAVSEIFKNADFTLFRDDIDPQIAINVINWAMNGFAETKTDEAAPTSPDILPGEAIRENYGKYLEEFKLYLDLFRKCFYKPKTQ